MVGGAVAHPAPTPEPDAILSRRPALQDTGHCHQAPSAMRACGSVDAPLEAEDLPVSWLHVVAQRKDKRGER